MAGKSFKINLGTTETIAFYTNIWKSKRNFDYAKVLLKTRDKYNALVHLIESIISTDVDATTESWTLREKYYVLVGVVILTV